MLASGRRAAEVSAFSGLPGDIAREQDGSVALSFLHEFAGSNELDAFNCPVRALNLYRKATKSIRSPAQRSLFISFNPSMSKDLKVSSISRWVKTLNSDSYKYLQTRTEGVSQVYPLLRPRTHEVRAWASSLAFRSTFLRQLLAAAYWRSPDVFISFI